MRSAGYTDVQVVAEIQVGDATVYGTNGGFSGSGNRWTGTHAEGWAFKALDEAGITAESAGTTEITINVSQQLCGQCGANNQVLSQASQRGFTKITVNTPKGSVVYDRVAGTVEVSGKPWEGAKSGSLAPKWVVEAPIVAAEELTAEGASGRGFNSGEGFGGGPRGSMGGMGGGGGKPYAK